MQKSHLLILLLSTTLPSCNGCQDNKPAVQITESELELQDEDDFLSPCDLLAIEIVQSSSFYVEYFGDKTGVFVGISNKDAVRAGTDPYYAISVQYLTEVHELTLDLKTLTLTHNRDDRQKAIAFDPALRERFRKMCVPEK